MWHFPCKGWVKIIILQHVEWVTESDLLLHCLGDGCNSVVCLCGNSFSWSSELAVTNSLRQFLETFPQQPSQHCAEILCSDPDNPSGIISLWQHVLVARFVSTNHAISSQAIFKTQLTGNQEILSKWIASLWFIGTISFKGTVVKPAPSWSAIRPR
jgi:hypothetical protein